MADLVMQESVHLQVADKIPLVVPLLVNDSVHLQAADNIKLDEEWSVSSDPILLPGILV